MENLIKEGLILAGGLGTRLRSVVNDVPKPMAPVNGKPFLEYLLLYLSSQGIERVVLSVGYMKDKIINYFGLRFKNIEISYSAEEEPLGTGGAVKHAMELLSDTFFIFNGDTIFMLNLSKMHNLFLEKQAHLVMGLKCVNDCARYGSVEIDNSGRIVGFSEKKAIGSCIINGGVYLTSKDILKGIELTYPFSWERDFLEKFYKKLRFYGIVSDDYFIDIGMPEDYERAQDELKRYF